MVTDLAELVEEVGGGETRGGGRGKEVGGGGGMGTGQIFQ